MKYRVEKDSLGTKKVPAAAYYGVESVRAIENFPISGVRAHSDFIWGLAMTKKACARANVSLKRLDARRGRAIIRACDEVLAGKMDGQFPIDVLQGGAGVSSHMNFNEVLANRALEILGRKKGDYAYLHSHDHVNMGQSTNDVIPTAGRLGALKLLKGFGDSALRLEKAFAKKAREFANVIKSGRTHMQDAAPITLGQEFGGWTRQLQKGRLKIELLAKNLLELGIGGSAVGTGLNTTLAYRRKVVSYLKQQTGLPVRTAQNTFEVMQSDEDFCGLSSGLRDYALALIQICNDLRLLSSGPKTGLSEIRLPERQPGSSIMPGKVNPVMPEVAIQTAFQVIGNDLAVAFATASGQLELNVMRPILIHNLMHSLEILKNVTRVLSDFCVEGIQADRERCFYYAETGFGIAAALNPHIGYSKAAECVKEAIRAKKTLREVVLEKKLLTPAQVDRILSPRSLTRPKNK